MRKGHVIGLIAAGKITDSPLTRIWAFRERLGPVKAPSMRVASRISNSLRAGHPVCDYQDFDACGLILISTPDPLLPRIVEELSAQPLTWIHKTVVLCSALLGSNHLERLSSAGASVGSLCAIPGFEDRWFLLEGDKRVETQIGSIMDQECTRITPIRNSSKQLYMTALACTGSLFTPLLIRAGSLLKQAGVPITESEAIIAKQVERTMRMYFRAGQKVRRKKRTANPSQRAAGAEVDASGQVRSQHA